MSYKVAIRKNATGEVRLREMEFEWFKSDGGDDHYWWSEGNFACDCNRELEFERAAGNYPDPDSVKCGDTAFTAIYAELPDGTRIEIDGEELNGDQ